MRVHEYEWVWVCVWRSGGGSAGTLEFAASTALVVVDVVRGGFGDLSPASLSHWIGFRRLRLFLDLEEVLLRRGRNARAHV